jgi:hypothetical protein
MKYLEFCRISRIIRLLSEIIRIRFSLDEETLLNLEYYLLRKSDNPRLVNYFQIIKRLDVSESDQNFCLKKMNNGRYPAIKRVLYELYCIFLAYTELLERRPLRYIEDWAMYPEKKNKENIRNRKAKKRYDIIKYIATHPLEDSKHVAIVKKVSSTTVRVIWFQLVRHLEDIDNKETKLWGYLLATICFGKVHWKYLPKLLELLESTKTSISSIKNER